MPAAPARRAASPAGVPHHVRRTHAPPRRLSVVTATRRAGYARARRVRLVYALAMVIVAGAMFATVAARGVLAQRQLKLDGVNAAVATDGQTYQRLDRNLASMESPARIVHLAETRLGMVQPTSITYLNAPPSPAASGTPRTVPPTTAPSSPTGSTPAAAGR